MSSAGMASARPCGGATAGSRRGPCGAGACTCIRANLPANFRWGSSSSLSSAPAGMEAVAEAAICSLSIFFCWCEMFIASPAWPMPKPLMVLARIRSAGPCVDGGVVGGEDLEDVVAAAVQLPDLVVGPVGDQALSSGVLKKCSRT